MHWQKLKNHSGTVIRYSCIQSTSDSQDPDASEEVGIVIMKGRKKDHVFVLLKDE